MIAKSPDRELFAAFEATRNARIYFLHHSVGGEVLNGVLDLATELGQPAPLLIDACADAPESGPVWLEECGGRNCNPDSKIEAFADSVRRLQSSSLQVAFMKLCFVDFAPFTNEDALFLRYQDVIEHLRSAFPQIVFAHVTAPLVVRPTSIRDRIKRLVGRPVWNDTANAKRNRFNERLFRSFRSDPIFDLARIQSTRPSGKRETFYLSGQENYCMDPAYTSDGGHLNRLGQRLAAIEFIRFLAAAVRSAPR